MRRLALALPLIVMLAAVARADERETLLVLPLEGRAQEAGPDLGPAATDLLEAALGRIEGVVLVERTHLERVLAEQGLSQGAGAERGVEIGRLVAATRAVTGTVGVEDGRWRYVLRVLAVPDGALLGSVDVEGDLEEAPVRAAFEVAAVLGRPAPTLRATDDRGAAASLHYLRGLARLRTGLFPEAIGEFLEARRLAVRFPETELWMGRAYLEMGEGEHAGICLRAFLVAAPGTPLCGEAVRLLARAARQVARAETVRAGPRTLAEILMSDAPAGERDAAVVRWTSDADTSIHDLEAALVYAYEPERAARVLLAIADLDPDRFVHRVLHEPECLGLRAWGVEERFRMLFTPECATRFARGLLAAHPVERDAVLRFLQRAPVWQPDPVVVEAIADVRREAIESRDEDVSLSGITASGMYGDVDEDALPILAARLADSSFSPRYRTCLVPLFASRAYEDESVASALLGLLGDENAELRKAVRTALGSQLQSWGGGRRWNTDRTQELRSRFGERMGELLTSRRFPEDAWEVVRQTNPSLADPLGLARELFASSHPTERKAGFYLLYRNDAAAGAAAAWTLLDPPDPDYELVGDALYALAGHGDPVEVARQIVAWLRRRQASDGSAFVEIQRDWWRQAFLALARRVTKCGILQEPSRLAEPETYADWIRALVRAQAENERIVEPWEAAGPAERGAILAALGEVDLLDLWLFWQPPSLEQADPALYQGWQRGLLACARRLGIEAEDAPESTDGLKAWRGFSARLRHAAERRGPWLPEEADDDR